MISRKVEPAAYHFSNNANETLVAASLGCCVGLSLYDPTTRNGGMMVFMLPDSEAVDTLNPDQHPYLFADTAIGSFLQAALERGMRLERCKLVLAGGGQLTSEAGAFNLGARNSRAAVKALVQLGLQPTHHSLGGVLNRTMSLNPKTGLTQISVAGRELETV